MHAATGRLLWEQEIICLPLSALHPCAIGCCRREDAKKLLANKREQDEQQRKRDMEARQREKREFEAEKQQLRAQATWGPHKHALARLHAHMPHHTSPHTYKSPT